MKKPQIFCIFLASAILFSCTKEIIQPIQNSNSSEQNNAMINKDLLENPYKRVIGEIGKTKPEKEITINSGYIEGDILYLNIDYPNLKNIQFRAIGDPIVSKTDPPQRLVTIKYSPSIDDFEYDGMLSTTLAIEIKPFRIPEQVGGTVVLNINKSLLSFTYDY